jgi:septum formation protein
MEPVLTTIADLNRYRIILASRSPRRQQLLREMGLQFEVVARDFDESWSEKLTGWEIAVHIAEKKARTFIGEISGNTILITADTIVWCNNKVLGKPANAEEAVAILREISGNTHEVITGVAILSGSSMIVFYESTSVTFEEMSGEEIRFYAENFSPFDKAGAYGIQEWIGIIGCSRIEGSYFNVVGLPVHRVYAELKNIFHHGVSRGNTV